MNSNSLVNAVFDYREDVFFGTEVHRVKYKENPGRVMTRERLIQLLHV